MIKDIITEQSLFKEALSKHLGGNYDEALNLYKRILSINPNIAAIHNNIGLIYSEFNDKSLALEAFKQAINLDINFAEAYNNMAIIYEKQGKFDEAILYCQKAIKINPNFSKAYNNLGSSLDEIGKANQAVESFKKSIELNPNLVEPYNNLGSIYRYSGKYKESIKYYKQAIKIKNNLPNTRKNLGLVYLLLSNFEDGFQEFEWRIKEKNKQEYKDLKLKSDLWKGENLNNKIILILSEQGFGDIIQFARYVYELKKAYNVRIFFRTHKKLIHLFDNSTFKVISTDDKIPKHDYHTYLLSLTKFHYQREKRLLNEINYIKYNKNKFSFWNKKLSKLIYPKIGINWQGGTIFKRDKFRSIPLNYFEPLFNLKNLDFICLQKGYGIEQVKKFKYRKKLKFFNPTFNIDDEKNAFEDTIGILLNLDLIITSCTAIAHLASTLGVRTWILLDYTADWRWFLKKSNTPWYKNTKLYRQKTQGNWNQVFDEVKNDLKKWKK
tara:strand:+ start:3 stop:1487 length:1485 start_codon:yes stop_codon:yes gene_type:complete